MWGKEVSATLVRKETKKEEKHILLMCPRMRQWGWRDLQGLRGEGRWRGGGLRTRHVGKRGLSNGQKRNKKKKKKNITLLACPQVQAMAAVGVGAKGKRQRRRGGLRAPRRGCSHPSCVGCGDGPHGVVAGVVAATRRQAVKEEKKNRIWVKGGDVAQCIYMSNEVARLVAHFPMPINPHIQRNTVLY